MILGRIFTNRKMPSLTPHLILSFTYNDELVIGTPQELRSKGIPEAIILTQAQIKAHYRIDKIAKQKINDTVDKEYSPFESARWTKLTEEAEIYLNTGVASDYLLTCQGTNENLTDYCTQIITNKAQFEYILANIRKIRYEKTEEMELLTTPEDVLNYDHTSRW